MRRIKPVDEDKVMCPRNLACSVRTLAGGNFKENPSPIFPSQEI